MVGAQHDDDRIPFGSVEAEIHAPLLHSSVVDDIGSPHIALYGKVVDGGVIGRSIESAPTDALARIVGHFGHLIAGKGRGVTALFAVGIAKSGLEVLSLVTLVQLRRSLVLATPMCEPNT